MCAVSMILYQTLKIDYGLIQEKLDLDKMLEEDSTLAELIRKEKLQCDRELQTIEVCVPWLRLYIG